MAPPNPSAKICATCGRTFEWRKKWARHWDEVVHCSDRCRSRRARGATVALEARILALLAARPRGALVDLSDVLTEEERADAGRVDSLRAAARRLAHNALIEMLQRGAVVDPDHARGPVQLRLR